jgi:hypothetical protein
MLIDLLPISVLVLQRQQNLLKRKEKRNIKECQICKQKVFVCFISYELYLELKNNIKKQLEGVRLFLKYVLFEVSSRFFITEALVLLSQHP